MADHSGRFVLRIPPDLHARLRRIAGERGVSLNEYCRTAIEYYTDRSAADRDPDSFAGRSAAAARDVVGGDLVGVVLFGSQARGEGRESSDTDLLIVVSTEHELGRELYRRWDDVEPDRRVSPHFVHLPQTLSGAGSIWYEVALDGIVLHEEDHLISAFLQSVRRAIADGRLRRRYAHGHAYWVKDLEVTDA